MEVKTKEFNQIKDEVEKLKTKQKHIYEIIVLLLVVGLLVVANTTYLGIPIYK
ncbi:MAG: hypothetical protein PHW29_04430 [Flavobacterium sp.]|nr:hypothetical protein [Flavobacterium sp.]